ncbi:MAG TPA: ABATE domain-containing protein [Solirubrobacteraceae bacterium]|jgi:predicted RNA-binding Zn ribbon-like protein
MPVSTEIPPYGLQLVLDFVNTLDVEQHADALATPAQLAGWLRDRGLLDVDGPDIRAGEHRAALELREALRRVMRAHNGSDGDQAAAVAALDHAALAGQLSVRFERDGTVQVAPRDAGYAGILAQLLVPVARAAADGAWVRAKACDADDCQEAFYDRSRNRSARWCDMAVCGNRTKVRAYRSKRVT